MSDTTVQYTDLAHTLFPAQTDDENSHPLMSDVPQSLANVAKQYTIAVQNGDTTTAQTLLQNNPTLANCIFNADKYNWLRDAVIATQRYYLNDVEEIITDIAARTIGIDDENTKESKDTNTYSMTYIDLITKVWTVTVPNSWTASGENFVQTITVSGMKETYVPIWNIDTSGCANYDALKAEKKVALVSVETKDDSIIVTVAKQPSSSFTLKGKGI